MFWPTWWHHIVLVVNCQNCIPLCFLILCPFSLYILIQFGQFMCCQWFLSTTIYLFFHFVYVSMYVQRFLLLLMLNFSILIFMFYISYILPEEFLSYPRYKDIILYFLLKFIIFKFPHVGLHSPKFICGQVWSWNLILLSFYLINWFFPRLYGTNHFNHEFEILLCSIADFQGSMNLILDYSIDALLYLYISTGIPPLTYF